ncbi:MAG: LppM family (lipo)protein [Beutenbergiaceae bacterium]
MRSRACWLSLVALFAAATLVGCVRVHGDLSIDPAADTVSGTVDVAVENQWAIEQGSDPADLAVALNEELAAGDAGGVTGEVYDDGQYTGVVLTLDAVPWERLAQASNGALQFTRSGDQIQLRGDLSVLTSSEEPVATPWRLQLAVTFPEAVGEHDGDLDGRTVSWDIDQDSDDVTFFADSAAVPPSWLSQQPPALVVGVIALLASGLLVMVLVRRRRAADPEGQTVGQRRRQAREPTANLQEMFPAPAARQPKPKRPAQGESGSGQAGSGKSGSGKQGQPGRTSPGKRS